VKRPGEAAKGDRGSTIPLILGFFLVALIMVAGSIALGQAFVQQRNLQDVCDGAAAAAAASGADLDREHAVAAGGSLQFADVAPVVDAYLARDPGRRGVHVNAHLSADRQRITLMCEQTTSLTFGAFFGRRHVRHRASSSARAAVLG
jgi:Putative Flp pilus-assembly TadE/G-like